jgi:hypothetical protein
MKTKLHHLLLTLALLALSTLNAQFSIVFAQAITFTNPTPVSGEHFGHSVAALGTDRVLIGADMEYNGTTYPGAAYLFSTNGALITTFTNPAPASSAYFGFSLAPLGTDRVLVGAYGANSGAGASGAAYLFSTNGTLLANFINPAPIVYGYFGYSVAAVGTDRVLIGAEGNGTFYVNYIGAAYLLSTNGTLITTFANPNPAAGARFGCSVAAVGTDRVLIGAYGDNTGATGAGAAYLFSTNGTLLTTFTNPTPAFEDYFGNAVVAVGSDRVLIGAYQDSTGATTAGAAYLFSTNAALLTTFTNPTPAATDKFGNSVAAVGTDRVLIGAFQDDTGAADAGSAYLFNTNGTLLMTITNPTPAGSDYFGCSVAALGADRALIGAYGDNTGATDAGSAYLSIVAGQTTGPPPLFISQSVNTVTVFWQNIGSWTLQQNGNLLTTNWTASSGVTTSNGTNYLTIASPIGSQFFRLHQ